MNSILTLARMTALALVVLAISGCGRHNGEHKGAADAARPANMPSPFAVGGTAPVDAPFARPLAQGSFPGGRYLLSKVRSEGPILTVEFVLSQGNGAAGDPAGHLIALRAVNYVADGSGRQFGVLKDPGGVWLAAPIADADGNVDAVRARVRNLPVTVWFKFPAPPADTRTISLHVPGFGAIDAVPVQR